jgi:dTDP-4-dehydrorhamnose reductase
MVGSGFKRPERIALPRESPPAVSGGGKSLVSIDQGFLNVDSVLIIGAGGQLGTELTREFNDKRVVAPAHSELSIESAGAVEAALAHHRPDLLINCSAFHQVDQCEADPDRAFLINATTVGKAAAACYRVGIPFVTFSTDYVFAGDDRRAYLESDRAEPKNVYGVSKLAGENYALLANPKSFVFRISGVFGRTGFSNKGPTFPERMIGMAERREPIRVVDNIVFSPTYTVHAANAVRKIIEREAGGVYHITNSGQCSWYELAVESIRAAGLSAEIERTQYREEPGAVKRPIYSPLAHGALQALGMDDMPSWEAAVASYISLRAERLSAI